MGDMSATEGRRVVTREARVVKAPSLKAPNSQRASSIESSSTSTVESKVLSALSSARRVGMIADSSSEYRCKNWLMRSAIGSKVDLRTNATKKKPYVIVSAEFERVYDEAMSHLPAPLRDVFMEELEESNKSKLGSKSMCLGFYEDGPAKLYAVLSNKPTPKMLDWKALSRARDRLVSEVPAGSIVCRSARETLEVERSQRDEHSIDAVGLDPTTNSGPPFYKRGFKPNAEMSAKEREYTQRVYDYILDRSQRMYLALRAGSEVTFDVMVGQRLVNRGLDPLHDPKTKRLIMALEKPEAVLWKMWLPIVQEYLKKVVSASNVPVHVAWKDAPYIDVACQMHLDYCIQHGLQSISGDYSGFDASVVPEIWQFMAEGMASWFKSDSRFFKALNRSVIGHCRVLSPLGVIASGPSSVKSGSGGTNFVDCQYNKLSIYYSEEIGLYKAESYSVQGDDFFLAGAGASPEAIAEGASHLGLIVHPDKRQAAPDRVSYLQRLHFHGKKGGIASVWRVLASCLVYERLTYTNKQWNPYMEAIQLVSKLENASFHPAFEALVKYVAGLDDYHLFGNIPASQVIAKAGSHAGDLLSRDTAASISTRTMESDVTGFSLAVTNGVLRGEQLPPWGSDARFQRVYSESRRAGVK